MRGDATPELPSCVILLFAEHLKDRPSDVLVPLAGRVDRRGEDPGILVVRRALESLAHGVVFGLPVAGPERAVEAGPGYRRSNTRVAIPGDPDCRHEVGAADASAAERRPV